MTFLFAFTSILKLLVLSFFLMINWKDEGSTGWAFQHLVFVLIVFVLFLPVSFFEKAALGSRSGMVLFTYIPLTIVLLNLVPYFLGSWSTKGFILTQLTGIGLILISLFIYFRSSFSN